jgi:hypothetical protein
MEWLAQTVRRLLKRIQSITLDTSCEKYCHNDGASNNEVTNGTQMDAPKKKK